MKNNWRIFLLQKKLKIRFYITITVNKNTIDMYDYKESINIVFSQFKKVSSYYKH